MKINALYFVMVSVIFAFSSCEKESASIYSKKKIASEFSEATDELITYEYDDEGRLKEESSSTYRHTYEYSADKVEKTVFAGSNIETHEYFLNSRGLADSLVLYPGFTLRYTYDEEDRLKKIETYSWNNRLRVELFNYTEEGNLGTHIVENPGTGPTIYTFSYYEDEENDLSNYNRGIFFLGKPSNNLLRSERIDLPNGVQYYFTNEFEYFRDEKGCISERLRTSYPSNNPANRATSRTSYFY